MKKSNRNVLGMGPAFADQLQANDRRRLAMGPDFIAAMQAPKRTRAADESGTVGQGHIIGSPGFSLSGTSAVGPRVAKSVSAVEAEPLGLIEVLVGAMILGVMKLGIWCINSLADALEEKDDWSGVYRTLARGRDMDGVQRTLARGQ